MARWKRVEAEITKPQHLILGLLQDSWVPLSELPGRSQKYLLRSIKGLLSKELIEQDSEGRWRATPKGIRVWRRQEGLLKDKPHFWKTHLLPKQAPPIETPQQRRQAFRELTATQQETLRQVSPSWGPHLHLRRPTLNVLARRCLVEHNQDTPRPIRGALWRLTPIGVAVLEECSP